jgi:hypothetical protein
MATQICSLCDCGRYSIPYYITTIDAFSSNDELLLLQVIIDSPVASTEGLRV